jgi:hypothetical protein
MLNKNKPFAEQHGPSRNARKHVATGRPMGRPKGSISTTYMGSPIYKLPSPNSHDNQNPGGLLLDWKPAAEAKAIFHLYETRQLTLIGARRAILMSDANFQKLLEDKIALPGVLEAIKGMRLKCWTIFVQYVKKGKHEGI